MNDHTTAFLPLGTWAYLSPRECRDGHKIDIASYNVLEGDEVEIKNTPSSRQLATRCLEENRARNVPGWLTLNAEAFKAIVNRLPKRDEMEPGINEQLIVEFYSRF